MNKKLLLILLIAVFAFSGCGKKGGEDKQVNGQKQVSDQKNMAQKEKKMGLSAWLKAGKGTKCTLKAPEGDMTIYSKGDKVRIEGVPYMFGKNMGSEEPQIGVQVSDKEWMYNWAGKEGTKMNVKKIEEATEGMMDEEEVEEPEDWQDMVSEMEEADVDYDCVDQKLADSLFEPPTDIEFNDLTPMMTGMADWGANMQDKLESGEGMEDLDMEELQKMMEEFNE